MTFSRAEVAACETLALGVLSGALAIFADDDPPLTMRLELAEDTTQDRPRLFLRFPGILKSEYEVTLHLSPGTTEERPHP